MGKGFAPRRRQFTGGGDLRRLMSDNWRYLTSFMNAYVLKYDVDADENLSLDLSQGESGWKDWTPTLLNMGKGNGTIIARYQDVNGTIEGEFFFKLGSSSTVASSPRFSLPKPVAAQYNNPVGGTFDAALITAKYAMTGGVWSGTGYIPDGLQYISLEAFNAAGSLVKHSTVTATVPTTWGAGNWMGVFFRYERA